MGVDKTEVSHVIGSPLLTNETKMVLYMEGERLDTIKESFTMDHGNRGWVRVRDGPMTRIGVSVSSDYVSTHEFVFKCIIEDS